MAKRKEAATVILTTGQRDRLERLWFTYGNYGSKSTPGNHSFIQGILEHGIDVRPAYTKRTRKSEIPTPECEAAVDAILAMGSNDDVPDEREGIKGSLRIISNSEERPLPKVDTEMKAVLEDMKRRYSMMRDRLGDEGDEPEAA